MINHKKSNNKNGHRTIKHNNKMLQLAGIEAWEMFILVICLFIYLCIYFNDLNRIVRESEREGDRKKIQMHAI